jgi:hypothetical protein
LFLNNYRLEGSTEISTQFISNQLLISVLLSEQPKVVVGLDEFCAVLLPPERGMRRAPASPQKIAEESFGAFQAPQEV